jgi:hypothetical protein
VLAILLQFPSRALSHHPSSPTTHFEHNTITNNSDIGYLGTATLYPLVRTIRRDLLGACTVPSKPLPTTQLLPNLPINPNRRASIHFLTLVHRLCTQELYLRAGNYCPSSQLTSTTNSAATSVLPDIHLPCQHQRRSFSTLSLGLSYRGCSFSHLRSCRQLGQQWR